MSRLAYLIPRLLILGLVLVAVWLGKDPLIRYALIHQIQQWTGAQVEIAQLRSDFDKSKLYVSGIKITDPRNPMSNLLQADLAHLQFDLNQLWRRKFVIEEGQTSRLLFNAPRTVSGALYPSSSPPSTIPSVNPIRNDDSKTRQLSQQWIDQLQPSRQSTPLAIEDLEVAKLINRQGPQWSSRLNAFSQQAQSISPLIDQLRISLRTEFQNPLRDPVRYAVAAGKLKNLEQQAASLQSELQKQLLAVAAQKKQLIAAAARDQNRFNAGEPVNHFDSDLVSQLLLQRAQQEMVDEAVGWFRWFRESIPATTAGPDNDPVTGSRWRGTNVEFATVSPQPDILVKRLDLEGGGRLGSQHLNFVGTVFNLATQPQRHELPATFELHAQGNQHIILNCELDRRSELPVDRLHIQCPDLELPPQSLGHPTSLLVSLGPASRAQVDIDIQVSGEELSGTLEVQHFNVALHVDDLSELAGGPEIAMRINQDLIKINKFQSTATLGGTIHDYSFESTSDLGQQIAATAQRVVMGHRRSLSEKQKQQIQDIAAVEIKRLEKEVEPALNALANQLQNNFQRIAELKSSVESPSNQSWPKMR